MKVLDGFKKFMEYLIVLIMTIMVIVIFLATVGRYTGLFAIAWSEECARYCMVAMVYLGAMIAADKGSHFTVDVIPMLFPAKAVKIITIIDIIVFDVFCVFLLLQGWSISSKMLGQGKLSPMLELPLGVVYMVIPVGMILMAVYYTYFNYRKITAKEEK